ncbi:MAG TPA: Xaa-Pro peptidase family protein [Syntrophomonas sp.]|nr:Xaa-Pro peptidase family protein [Syntrophomonas sp.]
MEQRVIECQKVMRERRINAVVVRLSENIVLLSQYWPRNGFSFVFIPEEGEATLICPEADYPDAVGGTMQKIRTFKWVKITDGNPYENLKKVLCELIKEHRIPGNACVGLDIGSDAVSVPLCAGEIGLPGNYTVQTVRDAFGTNEIVSVNDIIDQLRECKNEQDITKINIANKIGKAGLKYFATIVNNPNVREIDVAAEVESYIARFACDFQGVKYARAWAQVSSGLRTADAWFAGMVSGNRKLEKGDLVMLEIGIAVDGYWCDLTETVCVGRMDGTKAEIYSAVMQAQTDAIMGIRHGITAGEIDQIARNTIKRAGFGEYFNHNTGHGVGFCYHEKSPILSPGSKDMLKSGMIHSVEPGIYIPGLGGVRLESNVLVCDDGYQILGID